MKAAAFSAPSADPVATNRELGVQRVPGRRKAYPEWSDLSDPILAKVAALPFIPPDWYARVKALQAAYPDDIFDISPVFGPIGNRLAGVAPWITDPADLQVWQTLSDTYRAAAMAYSAGKVAEGRRVMEAASGHAAFWDAAYRTVKVIADAPATIAGAASGLMTGIIGKALPALALLIGGAFLFIYFKKKAKE